MNQDRLLSLIRHQRRSLTSGAPVVLDFLRYGSGGMPDCLAYAGPGRRASNARGIMLESYYQTQLYTRTDYSSGWPGVARTGGYTTPDGFPAIKVTTQAGALNYVSQGVAALDPSSWYWRSEVVQPPAAGVTSSRAAIFEYGGQGGPTFNMAAGSITGGFPGAAWMEPLPGGFYRLHHTFQTPASPAISVGAFYVEIYGSGPNVADYIMGEPALVKLGGNGQGYPMAYLPNLTGASIARAGETLTLALDQQLLQWNPAGWSCVFEWENLDNRNLFSTLLWMKDPGGTSYLQLYVNTSGALIANVWQDNVRLIETAILQAGTIQPGKVHRVALAIEPGALRACVNGGDVGQLNVAAPMAAMTAADLGSRGAVAYNALRGWIRRIRAWGIALPNGDLQREST